MSTATKDITKISAMDKPFVVRFHSDPFLLTGLYICYTYKIGYDTLFTSYEKFGKDCLYFYDMLRCKGYIKLTRKQFYEIIESCTTLDKQIKNHNINKNLFNAKMQEFITFIESSCEDLYCYTIRLFFNQGDFHGEKAK